MKREWFKGKIQLNGRTPDENDIIRDQETRARSFMVPYLQQIQPALTELRGQWINKYSSIDDEPITQVRT